jgi:hypothetical protein
MNSLMTKGASEYIKEEDLPPLRESDESVNLGAELQRAIQKQYVPSLRFSYSALT